jgi:hypothetical protein
MPSLPVVMRRPLAYGLLEDFLCMLSLSDFEFSQTNRAKSGIAKRQTLFEISIKKWSI